MEYSEKVCVVIVTYNRAGLLIECINSLVNQTCPPAGIYIINNASTDGTQERLMEKGYLKSIRHNDAAAQENESLTEVSTGRQGKARIKIYYVRMNKNLGGSYGFCEGIKRAYGKGYDWIWVMDDDAEPRSDCLNNLLRRIHENPGKIAAITALKMNLKNNIQLEHAGFIVKGICHHKSLDEIDHNERGKLLKITFSSFVGLMVSRKAVEHVGFPRRDLFIMADDWDYSFRLSEYGDMFLDTGSVILHKENRGVLTRRWLSVLLNKPGREDISVFWKRYYVFRNLIYLSKKHRLSLFKSAKRITVMLLRTIAVTLLMDDYKWARIKLMLKACLDGLTGRMGKTVTPENWKNKFKKP